MQLRLFGVVLAIAVGGCASREAELSPGASATPRDRALAANIDRRAADWRNGAIVYQVIVDRFAPSNKLDAKRDLYPAPRTLHAWSELPKPGVKLDEYGCWSHELAFWGGDLPSLRDKLDYIDSLGADVLYLNPIHAAFTNHKYDAQDFAAVSPEYGTRDDVIDLAKACHARGMKIMLDGVFNHMGRTAPIFVDVLQNPDSKYRDWFVVDPAFKDGYRGWYNVKNLPELNLENPNVRKHLWAGKNSVVQQYLRDGIDGWRLDVAYDIGFNYLDELTHAAHAARRGSWVVGEIWCYPEQWTPAVDGVMNFFVRQIVIDMLEGKTTGAHAGTIIGRMIDDAGIEPILKSWFQLDNHDTPRLRHVIPDPKLRKIAQVLQFTLPGSPVIYYGSELGMDGGGDPANRAPMRWDLVKDGNADLLWMRKLIALRKQNRALRIGEYRTVDTQKLLAFSRQTDRVAEHVLVVVNPTDKPIRELFTPRDSKLMSYARLRDQLDEAVEEIMVAGRIEMEVPAKTVRVLMPVIPDGASEYSAFKRVH
ncbi:MAG TPA: glycoside hydrolase family 13 protein [Tepidisphaeraceae bacterium]|nr:glycoside hydrolase family 13 protein [Tepidisphaeraceae bacterium]